MACSWLVSLVSFMHVLHNFEVVFIAYICNFFFYPGSQTEEDASPRWKRSLLSLTNPTCQNLRFACYQRDQKRLNRNPNFRAYSRCTQMQVDDVFGSSTKFECQAPVHRVFQNLHCCGPCCANRLQIALNTHPLKLRECRTVQEGNYNRLVSFLSSAFHCLHPNEK